MTPKQSRQNFFYDATKRGFRVVGIYSSATSLLEMLCNHGHTLFVAPTRFTHGYKCQKCKRAGLLK